MFTQIHARRAALIAALPDRTGTVTRCSEKIDEALATISLQLDVLEQEKQRQQDVRARRQRKAEQAKIDAAKAEENKVRAAVARRKEESRLLEKAKQIGIK